MQENQENNAAKKSKKPSFLVSLSIILFLFVALVVQVILYGSPEIHITLIFTITYAVVVLLATGVKWKAVEEGVKHGCKIAIIPMLILMLVGVLISTFIAGGTIPTLIYYGLKIINPSIFLFTAALVCSVASMATGSSYTTGATFGVAFIGISMGLGIPLAMTAGAVITGAIFGDKMSPVSDSTNLAAAVAETPLFSHVKSMFFTTGPAILISLILYLILGFQFNTQNADMSTTQSILRGLEANFDMGLLPSLISLLPLVVVIVLAVKQVSGLAVMVVASIAGLIVAMVMQGQGLYDMMNYMNYGFSIETGVAEVDRLLNRGGLQSMMWTVSLGFLGLAFGGLLEKAGVLEALLSKMKGLVSKRGNLILTHVVSAILVNLISASQYIAIIIPGRMFLPAYQKLGINNNVCSRTCEDAATVTSPLVPWGLCGVYFTATLGVSTLEYLPYTFLAFLAPVIAIIYGYTGWFVFKAKAEDTLPTTTTEFTV